MGRFRRTAALALAALCLSCSPNLPEVAPPDSGPTPMEIPSPAPEATKYKSLADLGEDLGCEDIQSGGTGANVDLRDFGQCNIGQLNVDVYLVKGHAWDHIMANYPSVKGPGWIVICYDENSARFVQGTIGGRLVIPEEVPTPTPSS